MRRRFWQRAWRRAAWLRRLSGMTLPRSPAERCAAAFISSLPVFPASRSHGQDGEAESQTGDGSGQRRRGSSARFSQRSFSLRMSQRSLDPDWEQCCAIWQPAGSMRNGTVSPRRKRVTRTSARGCSWLLPTPTECGNNNRAGLSRKSGDGLATAINKMLPTPTANEGFGRRARDPAKKRGDGLQTALRRMLPTPLARDARRFAGAACLRRAGTQPLAVMVGRMLPTPTANRRSGLQSHGRNALSGALNPEFVCWMMGFPPGWTSCEPLGRRSFQRWLREPGVNFQEDSQQHDPQTRGAGDDGAAARAAGGVGGAGGSGEGGGG